MIDVDPVVRFSERVAAADRKTHDARQVVPFVVKNFQLFRRHASGLLSNFKRFVVINEIISAFSDSVQPFVRFSAFQIFL